MKKIADAANAGMSRPISARVIDSTSQGGGCHKAVAGSERTREGPASRPVPILWWESDGRLLPPVARRAFGVPQTRPRLEWRREALFFSGQNLRDNSLAQAEQVQARVDLQMSWGLHCKERRDVMPQIVLTDQQARILLEAKEPVEVRDPVGRIVSFLQPMDSLDVEAVARHRSNRAEPRQTVPAVKVQAHLRRLEEIRQAEGMNDAKMHDLLRRMQAGEEV